MKRAPGQRGTALVAAVFLIIVLALLGAAMATLSKVEADTAVKSRLAANVYFGAKAGLEWGIQRAISPAASCVATSTFALAGGALAGINVTVTCTAATQGSAAASVFYITSCATTGTNCAAPGASLGGVNYAERRLEATVSNIP